MGGQRPIAGRSFGLDYQVPFLILDLPFLSDELNVFNQQ